ncbi:MAG: hypothetical protein ACRDBO_10780 [Lachnospiraceae bacterium]
MATGTVLSKDSLQLIAKLVATGAPLIFTRAAVGTGKLPAGYDPGSMTGLNDYRMDGEISKLEASGEQADVTFQISSIGVDTGFIITEAGLFAEDPDKGEILFCYLDLSADPQYIYPENSTISKFFELTMSVIVGSVSSVTAYISPSALITYEQLDDELKPIKSDVSQLREDTNNLESRMTYPEFEDSTEEFPVPDAGEKIGKILGKVRKFITDFKNWRTGVVMIGQIVNNAVTNRSDLPVSAAVAYALQNQFTQLSSDYVSKSANNTIVSQLACIKDAGVSNTGWAAAPVIITAQYSVNTWARAQMGFHNSGSNAASLWLDIDGMFKYTNDGGVTYTLATTSNLPDHVKLLFASISVANSAEGVIGRYAIPTVGIYLINMSQYINYGYSGNMTIRITQNGEQIALSRDTMSSARSISTLSCQAVISASAGDEIYFLLQNEGSITLQSNDDGTVSYGTVVRLR